MRSNFVRRTGQVVLLVFVIAVVDFAVSHLQPKIAIAQTTTATATPPSCSTSATGTGGSTSPTEGFFLCVADLDGNGKKQVVFGFSGFNGIGTVVILENTGTIRRTICSASSTGTCNSPMYASF